jgi:quinol-cytochrome oxidoreductase complex cytochrome b subunit
MGICLSLPFLFDAINSVVTTHVYDATHNLALTWYIAAFVCVLSILAALTISSLFLKSSSHAIESYSQIE